MRKRAYYFILYIPFFISLAISSFPIASYFVAWSGSILILILTVTGIIKPLPKDRPMLDQLMRPVFLTHAIFFTYTAITSIFYFMDSIGFYYLEFDSFKLKANYEVDLIVRCQRYYVLGHAAYIHGLLYFSNYDKMKKWKIQTGKLSDLLLKSIIAFALLGYLTKVIPGLNQFSIKLVSLSLLASIILLVYSIKENNTKQILISFAFFGYNMAHAIFSGWKHEIIIPLILLATLLFPMYRKLTITVFIPLFVLFFTFVPAYNIIVRNLSWSGQTSAQEAAEYAIQQIKDNQVDIGEINWAFLTKRISEMSMFTKYVEGIPALREHYGFEIIGQALLSSIPRVFYPGKPITEEIVKERVLAAGVVAGYSADKVSAKPAFIADAYLSFGAWGVFFFLFILGTVVAKASTLAESLFGGYEIGSVLIYTGLFQEVWLGNCFEFITNSIIWSFVLMYLLFELGKKLGVISPIEMRKDKKILV